jgi:hypothetical protein
MIIHQDQNSIVLQFSPQKRTFLYYDDYYDDPQKVLKNITLEIPWLVIVINWNIMPCYYRLERFFAFISDEPVKNIEDCVYKPLIPNISTVGQVCLGNKTIRADTIEELVKESLDKFYSAPFAFTVYPQDFQAKGKKFLIRHFI